MTTEPGDLTPRELSEMLGVDVRAISGVTRIGTGQMSRNFRLDLDADLHQSVVIKVPAAEDAVRELGASAYQREVFFYADVARHIDAGIATCFHHRISDDGTDFLLVLEDLAPAEQGDQLAGCSIGEAERALTNLAAIHAVAWQNDTMLGGRTFDRSDGSLLDTIYPLALDEFLNRYRGRLRDGTADALEACRTVTGAWTNHRPGPASIIHGDYRLDNLLFTSDAVIAVDWQTVSAGPPARDVAYFLGNSLTIDDRRRAEHQLLEHYRHQLAGLGVDLAADELAASYALGSWLGPLVTVVGAFVASRTDRGDDMFIAMADRAASQIHDHDAVRLLNGL